AILLAGLDGIENKIDPGAPLDKNTYDLTPEEQASLKTVPDSLEKALEALERDHDFLTRSGVFTSDVIDVWIDYKREDGERTFGLLAQISPDGKHILCMVKDRSVFVARPDLAISQLFFPIRGILVYYRRATRSFHAFPGADDKDFVQANPVWSPDGKTVIFARAKAYSLKNIRSQGLLLAPDEVKEFLEGRKTFTFDLYRIPWNDGKGGTPEPLEGASNNGMSNYFPKFSPDGKWIVFCKAKSFMLLQPDSELYIMPSSGGQPRRMRCNTSRMNSWHSWSPNGRWLVFSSKAYSPYTQLFLTHVDEQGRDTPAILLEQFTTPNRAANIPEFVNAEPDAIKTIRQNFLDHLSYIRAGEAFSLLGDHKGAIGAYRTALKMKPDTPLGHYRMATSLVSIGDPAGSLAHFAETIKLDPKHAAARFDMASAYEMLGRY
ncbi:hypothetical protein LCGC14_2709620, partial [marine sediment metagenome]